MRKNKYQYLKVMQQFIEDQWADVVAAEQSDKEEMRQLRADIKAYRENDPYPIRVISRRIPIDELFHA